MAGSLPAPFLLGAHFTPNDKAFANAGNAQPPSVAAAAVIAYIAGTTNGDLESTPVATLTIRNVDPEVRQRLRVRAAQNGRSMEAELRQIVKDAVGTDQSEEPNLAEAIRAIFAPLGGVELELPPREFPRDPPTFDE
jgi:antitoxin FitA